MGILSRLFSKSPADLLAKGDRFLDSERFFDARSCYEDGLQCCSDDESTGNQRELFIERIDKANLKLAEANLSEAEYAFSRGDSDKAIDHLELIKTLTNDAGILKQAEKLLKEHADPDGIALVQPATSSSCSSCSHNAVDDSAASQYAGESLHPLEYFELLIRQLPEEERRRYSELGDDFAYAYVAASDDKHEEALSLFEKWDGDSHRDIYYCERGKILHRLGNDLEAEQHLRKAIKLNGLNSLAWLNLALLLIDAGRLDETMSVLDSMISENMMAEQAMLMRGEILELVGNLDEAVDQYSSLLTTPYARSAAEKLHDVLIKLDRHSDAALVFKQFLGKCGH